MLPVTPQVYKRTTRLERASPGWRPGALPTELHPRESTLGWNRTSGLCRRRAALCPLSYERKEPPAGVEPAPRPYKGRVLAVDTTEAQTATRQSRAASQVGVVKRRLRGGDGGTRTHIDLGASEVLGQLSDVPR